MNIQGLQKFTLLDYPGKLACTVFTAPCNLRCPFCHNSSLLKVTDGGMKREEIISFLHSRKGILEGVCVTGGEPTLYADLPDFLAEIKKLGFLVKLDTNGTNPAMLQKLVQARLVDYVALDVKNSPDRYGETVGCVDLDLTKITKTIEFLLAQPIAYEFRTTIVREFHSTDSLLELAAWIQGAQRYYLQNFVDSPQVLQPGLSSFSKEEMEEFKRLIKPIIPVVELRGV